MTWGEGRPIYGRLPSESEQYNGNPVVDALTKPVDELMVDIKAYCDRLSEDFLDPETCRADALDWLAQYHGYTGEYWDAVWTEEQKRQLIKDAFILVWPRVGLIALMQYLIDLFEIPAELWILGVFRADINLTNDTLGGEPLRYFIRMPLSNEGVLRTSYIWKLAEKFNRLYMPVYTDSRVCYSQFYANFSVAGDPVFDYLVIDLAIAIEQTQEYNAGGVNKFVITVSNVGQRVVSQIVIGVSVGALQSYYVSTTGIDTPIESLLPGGSIDIETAWIASAATSGTFTATIDSYAQADPDVNPDDNTVAIAYSVPATYSLPSHLFWFNSNGVSTSDTVWTKTSGTLTTQLNLNAGTISKDGDGAVIIDPSNNFTLSANPSQIKTLAACFSFSNGFSVIDYLQTLIFSIAASAAVNSPYRTNREAFAAASASTDYRNAQLYGFGLSSGTLYANEPNWPGSGNISFLGGGPGGSPTIITKPTVANEKIIVCIRSASSLANLPNILSTIGVPDINGYGFNGTLHSVVAFSQRLTTTEIEQVLARLNAEHSIKP